MWDETWAGKLFSSALFCVWLSFASVIIWFDDTPKGNTPEVARNLPESR